MKLHFLSLFCAALLLSESLVLAQATSNETQLKAVRNAWSRRLETYPSAQFSISIERRDATRRLLQGSDAMNSAKDDVRSGPAGPYVESRQEVRIGIDGGRMRCQETGMRPGSQGKLYSISSVFVSDGLESKSLTDKCERFPYPIGTVLNGAVCEAEWRLDLKPIFWTFGDPGRAIPDLKSAKIASVTSSIDSRPCILLESSQGDSVSSYWVDASKGYSIVRYTSASAGLTRVQLDCSYTSSANGCWVPTEWTITTFAGQKDPPDSIVHVKATDYTVNPAFATDEFRLEFPAGTVVTKSPGRSKSWADVVAERQAGRRGPKTED